MVHVRLNSGALTTKTIFPDFLPVCYPKSSSELRMAYKLNGWWRQLLPLSPPIRLTKSLQCFFGPVGLNGLVPGALWAGFESLNRRTIDISALLSLYFQADLAHHWFLTKVILEKITAEAASGTSPYSCSYVEGAALVETSLITSALEVQLDLADSVEDSVTNVLAALRNYGPDTRINLRQGTAWSPRITFPESNAIPIPEYLTPAPNVKMDTNKPGKTSVLRPVLGLIAAATDD
eukprot:Filipodium_phascolosomae@DN5065_c0_g1_i1.p1